MSWKLALYVLLAAAGGVVVGFVEEGRLSSVKADLKICQESNIINNQTIGVFKKHMDSSKETCGNMIKSKEDTIRKLQQRIETLSQKGGENEQSGDGGAGGPLLNELNGLFL
jgi:hypothetical protein